MPTSPWIMTETWHDLPFATNRDLSAPFCPQRFAPEYESGTVDVLTST